MKALGWYTFILSILVTFSNIPDFLRGDENAFWYIVLFAPILYFSYKQLQTL